ncbi:MAG: TetR/AcrR family transcriptional regulator [Deltaproteobacteria bacterium]|nr:TetR/AcrR family transcriptional regulator [Deltaproteobacteria bacterium]
MPRTEVAIERKHQIVKATVECVSKYGYNNFSMQDVARTAGVSKGIIHYYFLNKDDLMMSVLEHVAGDIERILQTGTKDVNDPVKKLEIFVTTCLNIVRETKEYYQVNMDFWTQINQKEEVRLTISKHYRNFRETCAKIIIEGVEQNVFKKVDATELASAIIALVDGISLQWLFDETEFNYDNVVKHINEMVKAYLQKPVH